MTSNVHARQGRYHERAAGVTSRGASDRSALAGDSCMRRCQSLQGFGDWRLCCSGVVWERASLGWSRPGWFGSQRRFVNNAGIRQAPTMVCMTLTHHKHQPYKRFTRRLRHVNGDKLERCVYDLSAVYSSVSTFRVAAGFCDSHLVQLLSSLPLVRCRLLHLLADIRIEFLISYTYGVSLFQSVQE